ncbi:protein of unknown function [Mariniphaga anaerophila]|uniref:DUF4292 domain-containing protein n=1 Tax=Mariniphaga anaerophila TaxID=1484053 RepID=A0A1M5EJP1_9BACT|nr:DUF4292 domain-containing protein [Mariniphaga anaerophila]SHF79478.1 protein of unknown function [Mariniphaga anaerophila]
MKKLFLTGRSSIFILFLVVVAFSSCRTSRDISSGAIRPLAAERLLEQVEQNAFDYSDLTIRRINVQFSNNNSKTSFRANLKAVKDDKILASISKINIPVGKVLLTPDQLTYVNYIDRNYFEGDYSFLSNLLNFNLSFETIQAIISNNAISYHSKNQKFNSFIEDGKYVLQSANKQQSVKTGRLKNFFSGLGLHELKSEENTENSLVQTMYFNPRNFTLEKLVFDDPENDWHLEANFRDFERVEKKDYPGTINVKMMSPDETIELKIKLNGFSTETIDSINLNIPDSYKRIRAR